VADIQGTLKRELFKKLKILLICSEHIFSLLLFVAKKRDLFLSNFEVHTIQDITIISMIHLATVFYREHVTLELKSSAIFHLL
jgi:hypothetical protein